MHWFHLTRYFDGAVQYPPGSAISLRLLRGLVRAGMIESLQTERWTMGGRVVPHDERASILEQAIPRLARGESTELIAQDFGITGRTLRLWLHSDASEAAEQARCQYLTADLLRWQDAIESADDIFPLARAREGFRAAAWLAERRLPRLFGARQGETGGVTINVTADALAQARQALQSRVIDVTPDESEG